MQIWLDRFARRGSFARQGRGWNACCGPSRALWWLELLRLSFAALPNAISQPGAREGVSEDTCYADCVLLGEFMEQVMMDVGRVTDQELIARLRDLVRADRTLSAR